MASVALLLKSSLPLGQLARIALPVAEPAAEEEGEEEGGIMPPPLPAHITHISSVLDRVEALATSELPFVAWIQDSRLLQVACPKSTVVKVLKLLHSRQRELGVTIRDAKAALNMQPMPQPELEQACSAAVRASLLQRGWSRLDDAHMLGGSLLGLADGAAHVVDSLQLRAEARQLDTVVLLLRAEVVRFRHPAARGAAAEVDFAQLGRQVHGSICTVLPDFRPGIITGVQPADAALLQQLRTVWASYGFPLPAVVPYLVSVAFSDNPDAPCFPFPPCCVLSHNGLDPLYSRLDNDPVKALLARVREDLAETTFGIWGGASLKLTEARVWYPDGPPAAQQARQQAEAPMATDPFTSASALAAQQAQQAGATAASGSALALGPVIDLASFSCPEAAGGSGSGAVAGAASKPKKPHAHAGPALTGYLQKLQQENASALANKLPKPVSAATTSPKPARARLQPAPGAKPAAPLFKSTAAPKPVIAAGQKRPGSAAGGAAAKAAKLAAQPAPEAALATGGVLAAAPEVAGAKAARPPKPPKKAAAAAAGGAAEGQPVGDRAGAGAPAAAAAKPPKPKAPPLVVEAVVEKVLSAHSAGKLGSLTIPELKCYLKSVKKAVGGKKAELEERVRQHLALPVEA